MKEKDIWADVHQAIKVIESMKSDLDAAYEVRDKEIAALYRAGIAIAQIARRVELSQPTVHKILKQQDAK